MDLSEAPCTVSSRPAWTSFTVLECKLTKEGKKSGVGLFETQEKDKLGKYSWPIGGR